MSELKACPFCGGELSIENDDDSYLVICENCGYDLLTGPVGIGWWKSKEAAIANANSRPIEDALNKRVAELERTVDDLRGELAQSDRASDVTRIAELEAAINHACSGCWAKDAPDAAQCRLCGLKNAMKANKP